MRQRILSWGDDFTIKDADGRDRFYVDGKVFSFGDKLSLQDMGGRELALIDQKLLSWGPQYEIIRGATTVAVVKKHFPPSTLLRQSTYDRVSKRWPEFGFSEPAPKLNVFHKE